MDTTEVENIVLALQQLHEMESSGQLYFVCFLIYKMRELDKGPSNSITVMLKQYKLKKF